jgi:uroporphyrinogen decarboxylase
MLTALSNGRPDRLPCQVHGWMKYYLDRYLGGADDWQAFARFGMDHAIYVSPRYEYAEADLAKWAVERTELGVDGDGNHRWHERIVTPGGELSHAGAWNAITGWTTEYLIKGRRDFELWERFCPVPVRADLSAVRAVKERLGDRGVIRSHPYSPGQGSPWQSFCTLADTERAIMFGMDEPEFLHHAMEAIVQRTLRVMPMWEGTPADMIEIGGGAGSSTVISPTFFREFCLPYDRRQIPLLQGLGMKVVYHLCGGLMPMLDLVVETGADGLETMTPPAMGGDCDLAEASRRVGERLFFIGGFDQNAGFERGTPERARELVRECFEATRDHAGYICCPSDHFFHGDPSCLQAFADEARECVY